QTYYLARALRRTGLRVCHIVADVDGLPREHEGIRVVTQAINHDQNIGQYSTAIVKALNACNAKLYVQRSAGYETGIVASFAKARRRRFIFSSSSTSDFDTSSHRRINSFSYRIGLRLADAVVVQSEEQLGLLQTSAIRVRAARVIPSFAEVNPHTRHTREAFLWIGALKSYKDPLAYVGLAELVPDA